ncbi:metallophosphoesterase family protein [Chitinivorax sp. PXF-14]|uniref:metallophosphoesterase family protein n=1 Tax=Chitinivorax sp. PXF-14 TaxID=3230488 RepID=UPI003466808E
MRIALFSDLHANREALAACLAHAAQRGYDRLAFLGDLVGYGADPGWVVDQVMDHANKGAWVVQGNHDLAAVQAGSLTMAADANRAAQWTSGQLSEVQRRFLSGLPLRLEHDDCLFVHANAWAPGDWGYIHGDKEAAHSLQATPLRYTLCGHMHPQALYHLAGSQRASSHTPTAGVAIPLSRMRRWLAVVGSVGQPRDGNPAACYAEFDLAQSEITFLRVPYDHDSAARKIRQAGLPARLADRLASGT